MKRLLLLFCFGIITSFAGYAPQNYSPAKEVLIYRAKKQIFIEGIYFRSLTPELLMEALYYCEIKQPEIVYKQAIIETGWFTSDIYTNANNIFGMRLARMRPTIAIGEYNHHAKYSHWFDSVIDYGLWQAWHISKGRPLEDYYSFLIDVGYATDKHYISKLKSISDAT